MKYNKVFISIFIGLQYSFFVLSANDQKQPWVQLKNRFERLEPVQLSYFSQKDLLEFKQQYEKIRNHILSNVKTKSNTELVEIAKSLEATSTNEILRILTFVDTVLNTHLVLDKAKQTMKFTRKSIRSALKDTRPDFNIKNRLNLQRIDFESFVNEFGKIKNRVLNLPDTLKDEKLLLSTWCDYGVHIAKIYLEKIASIEEQIRNIKPWMPF